MFTKKPPFPVVQNSSFTHSSFDISSNSPPKDEAHVVSLNTGSQNLRVLPSCSVTISNASISHQSLLDCNRSGCSQNILTNNLVSSSSLRHTFNDTAATPKYITPLPSPVIQKYSPNPWENHFSSTQYNNDVPGISRSNSLKNIGGPNSYDKVSQTARSRLSNNWRLLGTDKMDEENSKVEHELKNANILTSKAYATSPDLSEIEVIRPIDLQIRREPHLADQRELVLNPPTPPSSSKENEDSNSEFSLSSSSELPTFEKSECQFFEAYCRKDMNLRRWKGLKLLGEGAFSKVILAVSEESSGEPCSDSHCEGKDLESMTSRFIQGKDIGNKLVAIKICEYGPKGGASQCRMEVSIKRELEFLRDVNHPSIVHLKAWNIQESRAILVLNYCQAGDLFEVASRQNHLLVPGLLRRIFAELTAAVHYLHTRKIVHRDIKLENVLVNLSCDELELEQDWSKYPYSVVTLTDFGLSRRINGDEKLETRCGSDDYAAPEVVMGQLYDGRAIDAWSLGVLLYALLEGRLPFDPIPSNPEDHRPRSRTSHLIARVEWHWVKYAGSQDSDQGDLEKFRSCGLEGAMQITEGLLKRARSRWSLDQVLGTEWVKGAIQLEKGIKFRDEDDSEIKCSV